VYIEFSLPQGLATRVMSLAIKGEIAKWAKKYGIPDSAYSQKTIKYTHRLGLNNEKYFSLFTMTWDQCPYQIVQIENEQY